jgi:D-alanyl-D-alanine carboxypeptidase (penicillin-binding protein 5/6)
MQNQKENHIPMWLMFFNMILFVSCLSLSFLIYSTLSAEGRNQFVQIPPAKISIAKTFENVSIIGKSALVFDLQKNTVIYEKNDAEQLPLASITKLMTALTAMDLLPKDSQVTIRKEFLQDDDSGLLTVGESWSLKNLLDFSLVVSSNGGARSIASVIGATLLNTDDFSIGRADFIKQMNLEAQKLGLSQSYFLNESGLDENSTQSGGYGSALDVEKLMQYILLNQPDILESTKYSTLQVSSLSRMHTAVNTDTLADNIPGLLASKTGYTNLAGGNLAVVFDTSIGRQFILVVLGSTEAGRFTDVQKLVDATVKYANQD